MSTRLNTSWNNVSPWYDKLVGTQGHYYHQHVVLPGVIRLLDLQPHSSLIDFGCGQGILARSMPSIGRYLGLDSAGALIQAATQSIKNPKYAFSVQDVTKQMRVQEPTFTHGSIILALQNMEHPEGVFKNAAAHLLSGGTLVIVLNHPSFRIPRQSGWKIDEQSKQQYRWINRYLSPMKVPIDMTPGQKTQKLTWSFHRPLQEYVALLRENGFVITHLEEWTSDKQSKGSAASMENRARKEIPLFMAIRATKL